MGFRDDYKITGTLDSGVLIDGVSQPDDRIEISAEAFAVGTMIEQVCFMLARAK